MLLKHMVLISGTCLVSSCATSTWIAPDAGSLPSLLKIQMDVPKHKMSKWLLRDLPTDSAGMRDWIKPSMAKGIIKTTKIDSIKWLDTLSVAIDTESIDGNKYPINKPVSCSGESWILTIGNFRYFNYQEDPATLPALFVQGNYALFNCANQRVVAKGMVYSRTPFFNLKKSNWESGFSEFGAEIGKHLPRKK